ncbi:hypothetical protein LSUB1_G005749 [Lachnellula subtilissima]|uniref:Uncharacterized protein n=1 Tax=Lachnellula subtilissima TaxID=602034 RepID=A0A8H8U593_9HELO|nr:hypothetical protein LSUB1_G005749 [Lachnellula subtilissima]
MHRGQPEKLPAEEDGEDDNADSTKAGKLIKGLDDWRDGFYEPMGYHTGDSGNTLHGGIWGTPAQRQHIWNYCPEMKMTLVMDAAKYVPGNCNNQWKRWNTGDEVQEMDGLGVATEIINGH